MEDLDRTEIIEQILALNCPFNADRDTTRLYQLLVRTRLTRLLDNIAIEAVTACLKDFGQVANKNKVKRKPQLLTFLLDNPDMMEAARAALTDYRQGDSNIASPPHVSATRQEPQQATRQEPQQANMQEPQQATRQKPQQATRQKPQHATRQEPQQANRREPQQANSQEPQQATRQKPQQATRQEPQQPNKQEPQKANRQKPQQANRQNTGGRLGQGSHGSHQRPDSNKQQHTGPRLGQSKLGSQQGTGSYKQQQQAASSRRLPSSAGDQNTATIYQQALLANTYGSAATTIRPNPLAVERLQSLQGIKALSLENPTNNCYANTAVTMLLQLDLLRQLLADTVQAGGGGPTTDEVLRLMHQPNGATDNLYALRRLVKGADEVRNFSNDRQHDTSEFLTAIIQCLETEVPEVANLFRGEIAIVRTCLRCGHHSENSEKMHEPVISVPISSLNRDNRLSVMIEKKYENEPNVDKKCERCSPNENRVHTVATSLTLAPKVMLVSPMRFGHCQDAAGGSIFKIGSAIAVDMSYTAVNGVHYNLRSFINHIGTSPYSGHYTITVEDPTSQSFTVLDDFSCFMQATKSGLPGLSSTQVMQSYVLCYLEQPEGPDEPLLQQAKRRNSVSETTYSPVPVVANSWQTKQPNAKQQPMTSRRSAQKTVTRPTEQHPTTSGSAKQTQGTPVQKQPQRHSSGARSKQTTRRSGAVPQCTSNRAETAKKKPASRNTPTQAETAQKQPKETGKKRCGETAMASGGVSPALYTADDLASMTRAQVEQAQGKTSEQATNQLMKSLLSSSIHEVVSSLTADTLKPILVKLGISTRDRQRWCQALCRFYLQDPSKQAQIRTLLGARAPDLSGSEQTQTGEPMEISDDEAPTMVPDAATNSGETVQPLDEPMEIPDIEVPTEVPDTPTNIGEAVQLQEEMPLIATMESDFYPDAEQRDIMEDNIAQLADYRLEQLQRINAGDPSLQNMPPNPILEAGHIMHEKLAETAWHHCSHCNETRLDMKLAPRTKKCERCQRRPPKKPSGGGTAIPSLFSQANDMHARMPPPELSCLNDVEQLCITRLPIQMKLYRVRGGVKLKGHCITFVHELDKFADRLASLPPRPADLPLIIVGPHLTKNGHGLTANRGKIVRALRWLQQNNPFYADIVIDDDALALYPDRDDSPLEGVNVQDNEEDSGEVDHPSVYTTEEDAADVTHSTAITAIKRGTEKEALESAVLGKTVHPVVVELPEKSKDPASEWTEGYLSQAFPTLPGFCYGECDITVPRVGNKPGFKAYMAHLLWHPSREFVKHPTFLLAMGNRYLRTMALQSANVYAKQLDPSMTIEQLQERVAAGDKSIIHKLMTFCRTVPGTRQFWNWKRNEAFALVEFVHLTSDMQETFNVFLTLSFPDNHITEMHRLLDPSNEYIGKIVVNSQAEIPLGADQTDYITRARQNKLRVEAVAQQPHICSEFLNKKLQLLIDHVLVPCLGAIDWIIRCEFQQRSSEHFHMVLRLKDGLSRDTIEAAFKVYGWDAWVESTDEQGPSQSDADDTQDEEAMAAARQERVKAETARAAVTDMAVQRLGLRATHPTLDPVDWPEPEGRQSARPSNNALRMPYAEAVKEAQHDLAGLVNRVQLHDCKKGYCSKVDINGKELPCKMRYPKPLIGFIAEETDDGDPSMRRVPTSAAEGATFGIIAYETKLQLLRNHHRVVPCIPEILQTWRGNTDTQLVESIPQLLQYILKYVMKAELSSAAFNEVVCKLIADTAPDTPVKKMCSQILMRTVSEHDYSRTECVRLFSEHPLVFMSRSFVTVNVAGTRPVVTDQDGDNVKRPATKLNRADRYWIRHDDENYQNMVAEYEAGELDLMLPPHQLSLYRCVCLLNERYEPWPGGVRVPYPTPLFWYPPSPKNAVQRAKYLRTMLLLHDPYCRPSQLPEQVEDLEEVMAEFVERPLCPMKVAEDYRNSLEKTTEEVPTNDRQDVLLDSPSANLKEVPQQDDFMLLMGGEVLQSETNTAEPDELEDAGDFDVDEENLQTDTSVDWQADRVALDLTTEKIKHQQSWLDTQKANVDIPQDWSVDYDPNQLNDEQSYAYNYLMFLVNRPEYDGGMEQLVHVLGEAGTGKSQIIKTCQKRAYQMTGCATVVRVMSLTNSAANHFVGGQTIHRLLKIDVAKTDNAKIRPLEGPRLAELQAELENCRLLIIDEVSFVGQQMLRAIDLRCRQAKPHNADKPFGGLSVALCGDPTQLPPPTDPALYCEPGKKDEQALGWSLYQQFTRNFVLKRSMRQDGAANAAFREQLRRVATGTFTLEDWQDWSRRSFDRLPAAEQEQFTLESILLCARKKDSVQFNIAGLRRTDQPILVTKAAHTGGGKAAGFSANTAGGLTKNLAVAKDAKIVLTANLWPSAGLVNGSKGTVEFIVFNEGAAPPATTLPAMLVCSFPEYRGPSFRPDLGRHLVPVYPVTRVWSSGGKRFTRTALPLMLGYSMTIHKAQGVTMNKAMLNLGDREFACGLTYTGVSRVRSLNDLAFYPFPNFSRIDRLKLHKSFGLLRKEILKREASAAEFLADLEAASQESRDAKSDDEELFSSQLSSITLEGNE